MSKKYDLYRQGDVLLMKIKEGAVPKKLKKTNSITLAYGESTGHHHSILGQSDIAEGFANHETDLAEFIRVKDGAVANLVHQEHDTIPIPSGTYQRHDQYEYTPAKIVRVVD